MSLGSTAGDDLMAGAADGSAGSRLLVVAYGVVSLLLLGAGILRPDYNWDLIPYIAAARALEISDPVSIHSYAYREIAQVPGIGMQASPPPAMDSPFRALMRNDPAAFRE